MGIFGDFRNLTGFGRIGELGVSVGFNTPMASNV